MSLGCVLFLWGIIAAIGAGVAAIGAAAFFGSAVWRSKLGMAAGGLVAAAGALVVIVAAAFIGGWLFWGMWPHETTSRGAFADAFGVPAGPEVTQIRSRTSSSTDSHEQFLRFHVPPHTIATIVRTRFQQPAAENCRQRWLQWKDDAPEWWTPSPTAQTQCYEADPYDERLMSNSAWLLYDPATGEARFHYQGVE